MRKVTVLALALVFGTAHAAQAKEKLKGLTLKPIRTNLSKNLREALCWEFTASTTNERICLNETEISPAQIVSCYTMTSDEISEAICLKNPGFDSNKVAQCYLETLTNGEEQFCLLNDDSLDPKDFKKAIEDLIGYRVTLPGDGSDYYIYDTSGQDI